MTVYAAALLSLLAISFFWPAEEAYAGAGLIWVTAWCLLGGLLAGTKLTSRQVDLSGGSGQDKDSSRLPLFGSANFPGLAAGAGWILMAAGQWLSLRKVLERGGDARSAVNLSLEWLGILVAWFILRNLPARVHLSGRLISLLIALGVGLAVLGIWQHHVQYHQAAAWYRPLRAQLDVLLETGDPGDMLQAAKLQRELQESGIPLQGAQRFLWEQRLLNSSEPTGTFALANSLSGILAVSLILVAGNFMRLLPLLRMRGIWPALMMGLCAAILCYCLILTKSRTSWAGCLAGVVWLLLPRWRGLSSRWLWRLLGLGSVVCLTCIVAASVFGALDREVILESPRSLQFRFLYWAGTAGILHEDPLWGTGPGNFRQAWLQHKWPESSEEIRDPHNWILDAWTSGGIISLTGSLLLIAALLKSMSEFSGRVGNEMPGDAFAEASDHLPAPMRKKPSGALTALIGALFIYMGWLWFQGAAFGKEQLPDLLLPVTALMILALRPQRILQLDPVTAQAATVALLVHLMGAGGFQLPAVMLCLAAVSSAAIPMMSSEMQTGIRRRFVTASALVFCVAGLAVSLWWGLIPVRQSRLLVALGELQQSAGELRPAAESFRAAAAADVLAVEPRQRLAELELHQLMNLIQRSLRAAGENQLEPAMQARIAAGVTSAEDACNQWYLADSRQPAIFRTRATARFSAAKLLDNQSLMRSAVDDQRRVVAMYPTSAADWYRLAEMEVQLAALVNLDASHDTADADDWLTKAQKSAERALRQDQVNQAWGHVDRFLTEEQTSMLKNLAGKR